MKITKISFYKSFYGHKFFRHFRRPPNFQIKDFKIQFTVQNPKQLYLHVHKNSGFHPCLVHVYNHGLLGNLKRNYSNKLMLYDRAFFDFDVSNPKIKELKNNLTDLRTRGPEFEKDKQVELKKELREAIINDKIAKDAIAEAKDFAIKFKESFGIEPLLFFSGCKGAHVYLFFNPINLIDINRAIFCFADRIKTAYNYKTLDLSVNKDAKSRLSRVPYSKHQYTGLTVVPFQTDDDYDKIMDKSLCPEIEPFTREDYLTDFNLHLSKIDKIESYNNEVRKRARTPSIVRPSYRGKINDHRLFFKRIIGAPESEYPDKEYVMYRCPFPRHTDNKPSFRVHKTGYYCYGCGRKGNYFQFLKDYNGWSNKQVKAHLKSNRSRYKGGM